MYLTVPTPWGDSDGGLPGGGETARSVAPAGGVPTDVLPVDRGGSFSLR